MRRTIVVILSIGVVLVAFGVGHRIGRRSADKELSVPREAAMLEVLPPQSVKSAADPLPLWQQEARRYVMALNSVSRVSRIAQNPEVDKPVRDAANAVLKAGDKALHVRIIPGTALIEFSVDGKIAGDRAMALTEAIVDQLFEDERMIAQNDILNQSVKLNNLKSKYQFAIRDMNEELRDKIVKTTIDAATTQPTEPQERGDLEYRRYQLEIVKDEMRWKRELLKGVTQQLDKLSQEANPVSIGIRWFRKPIRSVG